jgi:hypothetical protein
MSSDSKGERQGQAGAAGHLSYRAGCYAAPIRFQYGTAAEINFWDVVYFFCHEGGGSFDTSTGELVEHTGLSRQMVGRLRRQAVDRGALIEDVSWVSGHRFVLRVPDFDPSVRGMIWKPLGYVRYGWHHVVTPAIPKRVLNLYLQQPRQRVYHLDPAYVAAKCRRRFPYERSRAVAPLNLADVGKALRLLVRLGLFLPDRDGVRVDWATFNRPAPAEVPTYEQLDTREHPLFREAAGVDPGRAELALELFDTGCYTIEEIEIHFSEIFRDLIYVRSDDYALLKAKVYRHRNRPPGPNRWRNTWKAFQVELKRRVAEVRGPKCVLDLAESRSPVCVLTLDLARGTGGEPDCLLAVRMVSRVEWPWYLEAEGPSPPVSSVRLELRLDDRLLFTRLFNPGDAEVRYTLHPDEWPDPTARLTLAARCEERLPGVHVEAWLEARVRR